MIQLFQLWRGVAERELPSLVYRLDWLAGLRKGRGDARGGQVRTVAFYSGVQVLREGVVDNANKGFLVEGEGQGDRNVGVGVNEVCGAINGIDDEGWSGGEAG